MDHDSQRITDNHIRKNYTGFWPSFVVFVKNHEHQVYSFVVVRRNQLLSVSPQPGQKCKSSVFFLQSYKNLAGQMDGGGRLKCQRIGAETLHLTRGRGSTSYLTFPD